MRTVVEFTAKTGIALSEWARPKIRRFQATLSWSRRQPTRHLVHVGMAGIVAFWLLLVLLYVAVHVVAALFTWVAGWFSDDAAEPQPAAAEPQPPTTPRPLPEPVRVLISMGEVLARGAASWADSQSAALGIPGAGSVAVLLWLFLGLVALLAAWRRGSHVTVMQTKIRAWVAGAVFLGWLAITAWMVWQWTPAGSPLLAVLLVAVGVLAWLVPHYLVGLLMLAAVVGGAAGVL